MIKSLLNVYTLTRTLTAPLQSRASNKLIMSHFCHSVY